MYSGQPPQKTQSRIAYIDGLRGLAILMVMSQHSWLYGGGWRLDVPSVGFSLGGIFDYGHVGVNLFLLLSGFCLYWPYVRKSASGKTYVEPSLKRYLFRRCSRILPPYYIALLLSAIYALYLAREEVPSQNPAQFVAWWLALHGVMLHNVNPTYILAINGSLWSIALEFQLYILFPILVESYRRFPPRRVLFVVFLLCGAYRLFVDYGNYVVTGELGYTLAFSMFGRCFEFALGMYTARLIANWDDGKQAPITRTDVLMALLIMMLTITKRPGDNFPAFADDYWGMLFAALLVWSSRPRSVSQRFLSQRWIVWLGSISYSVYLLHLPIIVIFGKNIMRRQFSNTECILFDLFIVTPLVIAVSALFHVLFERPFITKNAPEPTLLGKENALLQNNLA